MSKVELYRGILQSSPKGRAATKGRGVRRRLRPALVDPALEEAFKLWAQRGIAVHKAKVRACVSVCVCRYVCECEGCCVCA
jgi:hypothetical protein